MPKDTDKETTAVKEQKRKDFSLPSFDFNKIPMPEVKPAKDQQSDGASNEPSNQDNPSENGTSQTESET